MGFLCSRNREKLRSECQNPADMGLFPFREPPSAYLICLAILFVATPLINRVDDIGTRIVLVPVLIAVIVGAWFLVGLSKKDDSAP